MRRELRPLKLLQCFAYLRQGICAPNQHNYHHDARNNPQCYQKWMRHLELHLPRDAYHSNLIAVRVLIFKHFESHSHDYIAEWVNLRNTTPKALCSRSIASNTSCRSR
jgi:hypothetical protein